jgi:hypothetical protein
MRNYYELPAKLAGFAVEKFKRNKERAIHARKWFLQQEGADAILRQEAKGIGLVYKMKCERSGFTLPQNYDGYWLIKPKLNTLIGKRIQREMDALCGLLEQWQWSSENALGLYESVFEHGQFHQTVCYAMPDNSMLVSQHKNAKIRLSGEYLITEEEFKKNKEFAL